MMRMRFFVMQVFIKQILPNLAMIIIFDKIKNVLRY